VAYGSDLEFVEKTAVKAALEIINKCDDAVQSFTPIVRFNEFADSSINFTLYFKVKDIISKNFIRHEIFKNIYKKFAEAKIEIPFPQRVVTIDNKGK
jgi:small-conductance mechanosensitive channel